MRGEGPGKICISIAEITMKDAIKAIKEANRLADLVELRMNDLKESGLAILLKGKPKPFMVTHHETRDIWKRPK